MTTQKENDGGSLQCEASQRAAENEKLIAEIFNPEFSDWDESKDHSFGLSDLKRICRAEFDRFDVPKWYTAEDHFQEVTFRFWKALPAYRGRAKLSTLAHRIAINQLIDVVRKGWCKEDSDDDDFFARIEQQLARKQNLNNTAERADKRILMKELSSGLTDEEGRLLRDYFVLGKTEEEISSERGVTPQAVQKRIKRVVRKMRLTLGVEDEAGHRTPDYRVRLANGALAV